MSASTGGSRNEQATETKRSIGQGSPSRRVLITGLGAAGMAVAVSACGGSSDTKKMPSTSGSSVAAADVPVGGAVYLKDISVIVTQPSKGDFKAFSSICTHAGCAVNEMKGSKLLCPCHGSQFDPSNGDATHGPASRALAAKKATLSGGKVVVS